MKESSGGVVHAPRTALHAAGARGGDRSAECGIRNVDSVGIVALRVMLGVKSTSKDDWRGANVNDLTPRRQAAKNGRLPRLVPGHRLASPLLCAFALKEHG